MVLQRQPPCAFFFVRIALPVNADKNIGLFIAIFLPPDYRTVTVKYFEQSIDLNTTELFLLCFYSSRLNSLIYFSPMSGLHRLQNSLLPLYLTLNYPRLARHLYTRSSGKRNLS